MASTTENLKLVATGERDGSATAVAMPDIACRFVSIRAQAGNAGNVYVGVAGVTVPNGTADATSGWPLDAGESITLPVAATAAEIFSRP